MAGLDPAIHVFVSRKKKDVDARDKPAHDDAEAVALRFVNPGTATAANPESSTR